MPFLFVLIEIVTLEAFWGIYILSGHIFSLFSALTIRKLHGKYLNSCCEVLKQENADNCHDFNCDEMLWGIKYACGLYIFTIALF